MHSALELFAQRIRIPTSALSIGFCVIRVSIISIQVWVYAYVCMPCAVRHVYTVYFLFAYTPTA
jgi:hypothetical protein